MSLRYEVIEGNFVNIYKDDSDKAFHVVGGWPNGERFESAEVAGDWAEMFIESVENLEAPYAPVGPGEPRLPKLTEEAVKVLNEQRLQALKNEAKRPSPEDLPE